MQLACRVVALTGRKQAQVTIVGSAAAQIGTLGSLSHDQYVNIACQGISLQRHPANQVLNVPGV